MAVPKLICGIEKQMRLELILIKNALTGHTNECELDPQYLEYAIFLHFWKNLSPDVRNEAFRDFLLKIPPFQIVYNVSTDGTTFHRKSFANLAHKPGSNLRKREHRPNILINRVNAALFDGWTY